MSNFRKVGLTIAVAGATATMVGTVNSAGNNLEIWHSDNNENSANNQASDCGTPNATTGDPRWCSVTVTL